MSGFRDGLGYLLHRGLLKPEFYGNLVYGLKRAVDPDVFAAQFVKVVSRCGGLAITLMHINRLYAWW